jgi:hypothetical protein
MPDIDRTRYLKVVVSFEQRPDGGLRAWSDDVPGFVLSHRDVDGLLADVKPALEFILSARLKSRVIAEPLDDLRLALEDDGLIHPRAHHLPSSKEYVALSA